MSLADILTGVEERLSAALATREQQTTALTALRERVLANDPLATDEAIDSAIAERGQTDTEIAALRARVTDLRNEIDTDAAMVRLQGELHPVIPGQRNAGSAGTQRGYDVQIRTGAEPTAYSRQSENEGISFFRDAFAVQGGYASRDVRERVERNEREVRATREVRAGTTGTAGTAGSTSFGALVIPQWLIDLTAPLLRAGRPLANAVTNLPLPDQGMQFFLPRATTGTAVLSQATENASVQNTDMVWGTTTVPVATIAGQQDLSRQLLERGTPGIDQLVYSDLASAYAAELDRQIYVGTGASGQITSINGQAGINTATLFGAAVTLTSFYSKLAGQINAIASAGTAVTPSLIVMHPRRWAWLLLQVDSQGRPVVVPNPYGPFNAVGLNLDPGALGAADGPAWQTSGYNVVGTIQGLPIITDSNVPTNLGGGSTEDVVFILDQRMALLFEEGDGMPTQLRFEQTLGNQLTVKLVVYGFAAFTAGRYPAAFGRVGGADATGANGLQAPTF
jgi:HK97 family phage major capsid protein